MDRGSFPPPGLRPSARAGGRWGAMERLAWILDSAIRIPGTRFRIGLDGLIGLIPGVGDFIGAIMSSWIVSEAVRLGVPKSVLLRMASNIAVESVLGLIPLVGDAFDFAWKANLRNLRLLQGYLDQPQPVARQSRAVVWGIGLLLFAVLIGIIALGVWLLRLLVDALAG